jgi:3',5'-cyclic AMP phosphodiesterase CpdA
MESLKVVVHLSDLHFGRVDDALLPRLTESVHALRPHVVAISGDFTQHARPREFEKARNFIRTLPGHLLMVPGNHDMAFLNPWRRVTQRLELYKQYISNDLHPFYSDAKLAIMGLNTARVTHLRDGRVREWQVDHLEDLMSRVDPGAVKILVTHHPFDLPESYAAAELIGSRVMKRIVAVVDVLLAGHMHISHAAPTALRYKLAGNSAIFVQAGTASSTRKRGEVNSFQVIRTDGSTVEVEQFSARNAEEGFHPVKTTRFVRSSSGWRADTLEVHAEATPEDLRVLRVEQRIASDIPGNSVEPRQTVG